MKLKRIFAAALCAAMLTGCGGGQTPEQGTEPIQTTAPNAIVETTLPAETVPVETAPLETVPQVDDALSRLRADMKPPVVATAYFGYWNKNDGMGAGEMIQRDFPNYWASNSYLAKITRTVGDYGTLHCVVPRDPQTQVTVNLVQYGDYPYNYLATVDRWTGEPFFLVGLSEQEDALLEVIFTEPDGRTLYWYPAWGEFHCEGSSVTPESQVVDYSIYDDPAEADTAGAAGALDRLRADMRAPLFAVASLSYWDVNVSANFRDYLMEIYPRFWPENEYLHTITDSYGDYGTVYCVVPASEDMEVVINIVSVEGSFPYAVEAAGAPHDSGKPFFMLSDLYGEMMMYEVVITAPNGETVYWYPSWNETQGQTELLSDAMLMADFSPDSEMTPYQIMVSNGWRSPDFSDMENHCWLSYYHNYCMHLLSESRVVLYDVDYDGVYTQSHSGIWSYEDGYLTLDLESASGEGWICTVPVLIDPYGYGDLWIGRGENGTVMPHFPDDAVYDELTQPKG